MAVVEVERLQPQPRPEATREHHVPRRGRPEEPHRALPPTSEPLASPVMECPGSCPGVCRDPGWPKKPFHEPPGDRNRGACPPHRYWIPDCERAGHPNQVARWARCSVDDDYSAWFVGGGAPFFRGRGRTAAEGTWGLDYKGLFGRANVWLNYTRGRKQGGEGAYQTDGEPELVKKVQHWFGKKH